MRWVVGVKATSGAAASPSQIGRFETQWLAADKNLLARIRRITHKSVGPEARFRYHFSSLFAH
jgi:hypothetical protein